MARVPLRSTGAAGAAPRGGTNGNDHSEDFRNDLRPLREVGHRGARGRRWREESRRGPSAGAGDGRVRRVAHDAALARTGRNRGGLPGRGDPMTQPPRTTESESRDNATIRDLMNQIQNRLTVPDRATLALGLIGHLATLMNGRQMEKLLGQLSEQAARVQDVPPSRRQDRGSAARDERGERGDELQAGGRTHASEVGVQGRGALTDESGPIL